MNTITTSHQSELLFSLRASGWTRRLAPLFASAALFLSLAIRSAAAEWTIVASRLNNPRGLDFAPNGSLYIAEAGTGGSGPVIAGAEGPLQFGLTGSITVVERGLQERIITGLPSLANAQGGAAVGPSDISFGQHGYALVTIGLGQPPSVRNTVLGPQAAMMGTLLRLNQGGKLKLVADLAAFEASADPDRNGPDSNPNGVWSASGGAYVTDAGGNTLVHADAQGRVSAVAIFPNRTVPKPPFLPQPPFPPELSMQAVPTNVVLGPDGALYVSQLTGFPFPPGEARIYRVAPGSAPTIYAEGFTNVIDLELDASGNLYVLEIDRNGLLAPDVTGRLVRVAAGSHTVETIASEGLVMPGGMAIGPDGAIYVSNYSTAPGAGQVVRIIP